MQLNIPSNRFAFQLFGETVRNQPSQNIVLAPISVWLALSAMANGAKNEALGEILDTLGLENAHFSEINPAIQTLLQSLSINLPHEEISPPEPIAPRQSPTVYDASSIQSLSGRRHSEGKEPRLVFANGIWLNEKLELKQAFKQTIEIYFDAEISALDFSNPATIGHINQWVNDKTLGKITSIVSDLSSLTALILASAIYFQANWLNKFEDYDTKPHEFTLISGAKRAVSTMFRMWHWDYVETDVYQAVRLAYRKPYKSETSTEFSMCIFLPNPEVDFGDFQTGFNREIWHTARQQFELTEGYLGLPKFSFDYTTSLVDILKTLGIQQAFDFEKADFGEVITQNLPLFIEQVLHKTYIGVDEEGTTAAGVAAILIGAGGWREPDPQFEMIIDRPFIFTIQDETTDTLLFIGSVLDPS